MKAIRVHQGNQAADLNDLFEILAPPESSKEVQILGFEPKVANGIGVRAQEKPPSVNGRVGEHKQTDSVSIDNETGRRASVTQLDGGEPESLRQAQTFQTAKQKYMKKGCCHACAAQAAWGHQNGFLTVKPPCEACVDVVALLPESCGASSPWRRLPRGSVGY